MQSPENAIDFTSKAHQAKIIPLVVILGPTGVGKSEMAIQLAEKFNGEIVSADSRLFYKGMDIGTAKPTIEERQRIPHHLIDVADPDELWSLGIFQKEAYSAIKLISYRKHLPFLVGGTGQFVHSIIEGWNIPSVEPNPYMREVLTQWAKNIGSVELHKKLAILDPQAALLIDPANQRRTVRALEVILSTGKRCVRPKETRRSTFPFTRIGVNLPKA